MKKTTIIAILIIFNFNILAQNINTESVNFIAKSEAKITFSKATNNINFIGFPKNKTLAISGQSPSEKALQFVNQNRFLFADTQGKSYKIAKESKDNFGFSQVTLQSEYNGVPIFDGVLKFHFDIDENITSINGNSITVEKLNVIPTITQKEAEKIALKYIETEKIGAFSDSLTVKNTQLLIFQKGLAQGFSGSKHLVYKIEVTNFSNIREFLFIDAHKKELIEQFTGIHTALDRVLFETNTLTSNVKWAEGDSFPGTLDIWQQSEVETAGHIYNLMKNSFGFTSFDGADATMYTVNNPTNLPCPNATWNGVYASFCSNTASDDVVAHEWAHGYTQFTNDLIYEWQAGAINESYSDIWGETVDQLNNYFDTGETSTLRTGCNSSNKWQVGEGATAFGSALRDMWSPNCKNDPGKVTDTFYYCGTNQSALVHTNSGVLNHTYALLADGGTYNGQTISGIGLTKAAHIFWYAQVNLMTATTSFSQQADYLEASLQALLNINLPSLSTNGAPTSLSGQIITAADALELAKVILAVELRAADNCNFETLLKPTNQSCLGAQPTNALFYENFENGLTNWQVSNAGGPTWIPHNWILDSTLPGEKVGKAAFAVNDIGDCGVYEAYGLLQLTSPAIEIVANTAGPYILSFNHYIATEFEYDGGNIEYSINGAAFQPIPQNAFTANGYNATLNGIANNSNPLAGKAAFTGTDEGKTTGSWGQSIIDLSQIGLNQLGVSQNIKFRWNMGQDACLGYDGWYIDDITLFTCAQPTVQFVNTSMVVNEAEATISNNSPNNCLNYLEKTITVKINKAPSQPVGVTLSTSGTATSGEINDYTLSQNTFTLSAANMSQNIVLKIFNDAVVEPNEKLTISYTINNNGGNGQPDLVNQSYTFNILDNDISPAINSIELLNANFNDNILPFGWQIPEGGSYPTTWAVKELSAWLDPIGKPMLIINSSALGERPINKTIETAPFNSIGMAAINLSFLEYFRIYNGAGDLANETATIEVWDGTTWQPLLTQTEVTGNSGSFTTPFARNLTIPISYANAAMKIRFNYMANDDYWWILDNIKVTGTLNNQVETQISGNAANQYLGPLATIYFFDPNTKNVIAKIKNLTNWDYGCTTVQIDRAGIGETNWFGPYKISNKTFKVTPSNNNPTGQYEITLYYKAEEINSFSYNSIGKSAGSILKGTDNRYAGAKIESIYGTDFTYTATFDSGFSGFGLSDAQPVAGPLPVNFVSFEGKTIPEGNQLIWKTADELNNDYFLVERADNDLIFKTIGKVSGKGNSKELKKYTFLDTENEIGINYYRLKQFDTDGKYGFSKTIALETKNNIRYTISPNPVENQITIEIPNSNDESAEFKILTNTGAEIINKKVKIKDGKLVENISGLPTGNYMVILKLNYKTSTFKIIKL